MPRYDRKKALLRCINARKGSDTWRCGEDWCASCGKAITREAGELLKEYLRSGVKPTFVTILIKAVPSYARGVELCSAAVNLMEENGIEGIWWMELGGFKDTDSFSGFWRHAPRQPGDHYLAHLHGFTKSTDYRIDDLFPAKAQVNHTVIGSGRNRGMSFDDNVEYLAGYVRKRAGTGVSKAAWVNAAYEEQWCNISLPESSQYYLYSDGSLDWDVDALCGEPYVEVEVEVEVEDVERGRYVGKWIKTGSLGAYLAVSGSIAHECFECKSGYVCSVACVYDSECVTSCSDYVTSHTESIQTADPASLCRASSAVESRTSWRSSASQERPLCGCDSVIGPCAQYDGRTRGRDGAMS